MTLENLVADVGGLLKKRGLKIATAESCTGGGLSFWLTRIAGSSEWFERGFVTYSDEAKIELLGVNPETIASYGAVSKHTVLEMAEGTLNKSHADVSIAITGIAGPGGGSAEKPVGLVWIAWAKRDDFMFALSDIYAGNREKIRNQAIQQSLKKLYEKLGV